MVNSLAALAGIVFVNIHKVVWYCIKAYQKRQFKRVGQDVYLGNHCHFTPKSISIGDNVYIGSNACFQSAHGEIVIGSHVMFGPGVHIHGGNHNFGKGGRLMKAYKKEADSDGVVVIEDDVWIGSNALILKGVRIGSGSIVGAGSVVTRDVPAFSIYTGSPALKLRKRFDGEELNRHLAWLEQSDMLPSSHDMLALQELDQ